jgi:N-acetylmuramoyl-L-alanine amidase
MKKKVKSQILVLTLLGFSLLLGEDSWVVIDPGHGGRDTGIVGERGVKEKDVVLKIATGLKRELERRGIKVRLTRRGDYKLSLERRQEIANYLNACLFISLHLNGSADKSLQGYEIYYSSNSIAQSTLGALIDKELKAIGLKKLSTLTLPLAGLSSLKMPGVLLELGFLTNWSEELKFKEKDQLRKIIGALSRSISNFLEGENETFKAKEQKE